VNIGATLVGQTVAFIFFVWFCMKYIWPPLMSTIEERQKVIEQGLLDADKAKNDLINAKQQAFEHIKNAKIQANKIIDEAHNQGASIIDKAKKEAEIEADLKIKQAVSEIEVASSKAKKDLISQISLFSIMGAEKIINSKINNSMQDSLIDELIDEINKEEYV